MANPSLAPELDPNDQIQFVADHRVGLEAGDYLLELQQEVQVDGQPVDPGPGVRKQYFSVLAERFSLDPQQVHAVFPPNGSRGDFAAVLPHVILERSTLPWERSADSAPEGIPPWLALLVFHQVEGEPLPKAAQRADGSALTLGELAAGSASPAFPAFKLECAQQPGDPVTVVDVRQEVLAGLLPASYQELDYRCHARRRLAFLGAASFSSPPDLVGELASLLAAKQIEHSDALEISLFPVDTRKWRVLDRAHRQEYEIWQTRWDGPDDYSFYRVAGETAVLVANRLPQPGARNVVHLVSLEGRYTDGAFQPGEGDPAEIRLVSLLRWEFFCEKEGPDFKALLEKINPGTAATFRLPIPAKAAGKPAEQYLRAGFVPLPHFFRQGGRSVSWYRGPLVPAEPSRLDGRVALNTAGPLDLQELPQIGPARALGILQMRPFASLGELARVPGLSQARIDALRPLLYVEPPPHRLPAKAADALLRFDSASGLFDASYAAAWELGRMLTLRNRRAALALYHWKRRHALALSAGRLLFDYGYALPVAGPDAAAPEDSENVAAIGAWLEDLSLLRHLPFNYLVPDEGLLPVESLRFFSVDPWWLDCLRDGAFSIGLALAAADTPFAPPAPVAGVVAAAEQQSVTLDSGASADDGAYAGWRLLIGSGPGARQERTIVGYDGASRLAKLDKPWRVLPEAGSSAYELSAQPFPKRPASGLLLRSAAVAGWPGLQVDAFGRPSGQPAADDAPDLAAQGYPVLNLLRMERLSKNVLFCLFDGEVGVVDIHLRPETLHFGFGTDGKGSLEKKVRDAEGNETGIQADLSGIWLDPPKRRILAMTKLAASVKNSSQALNPATFALQMVAGVELVRFHRP